MKRRPRHAPIGALLAFATLMVSFAAGADQPVPATVDDMPVVVELFTSQGCSSCPPADLFLGKLAERHDVLALAFHVDYWDYIGWKDPFAFKIATERQYSYGHALGLNMVYTPQMVIGGIHDAVGSDEGDVGQAIKTDASRSKLKLAVVRDAEGAYKVEIPAGATNTGTSIPFNCRLDSQKRTPMKSRFCRRKRSFGHYGRMNIWNGYFAPTGPFPLMACMPITCGSLMRGNFSRI